MHTTLATGVPKRRLGRTDIEITPIGLGTWQFAGGKGFDSLVWQDVPDDETDEIVTKALEGGVNWFDTAEAYGMGRSERRLALALQGAEVASRDITIATKWMPLFRTASSLHENIDSRIEYLQPYPVGLFQIHQPIALSSVKAQMDAMADLVEAGKIRAVGISNFPAPMMRRAHAALASRGITLASNQVKVSLLNRRIETLGVLKAARDLGMTIIAWSPLEMGVLSGKFHADPSLLGSRPIGRRMFMRMQLRRSRDLIITLEEIAAANGVTPAVVALSWLVNFYGETVVAIPGASKVSQVEQNIRALELRLSEREMSRLDELSSRFRKLLPLG
ncbi:MAG: aldo/keto reductase [Actinobacteria bacterium]|nr:aldo/keto reductase [Actinomycetota bacterium]